MDTKIFNSVLVYLGWLSFFIGLFIIPKFIFVKVIFLSVARVLPFMLEMFKKFHYE